jgi:CubicO group peptidase (beta-lactamase class C family)
MRKKGEFTGTALVIDDGQIIYRGAWGENAETKLPLSPESRIYLASAAKPITALVAALLESRGRLSYEAPVAPHFPGLAHLLKGVKLKHLLAHTSGLEDYYRSGLPVPPFTNEDALRLIAGQKATAYGGRKIRLRELKLRSGRRNGGKSRRGANFRTAAIRHFQQT